MSTLPACAWAIGTGSSAVQSIPIIAQQARGNSQNLPAHRDLDRAGLNEKLSAEYLRQTKAQYPALRAKARARPLGYISRTTLCQRWRRPRRARAAIRNGVNETRWPALSGSLRRYPSRKTRTTRSPNSRDRRSAPLSRIPRPPSCSARRMFSGASGCVWTPITFETYNLPHSDLVNVSRDADLALHQRRHLSFGRRYSVEQQSSLLPALPQ